MILGEVDLLVLVCQFHIVLVEEKHNRRGLVEVCRIRVVVLEGRVVVHLLGGLWGVEEGVSSMIVGVVVGVGCIAG